MVYAKGFTTLGAFKKSTTWGTPVVLGALNGFEYNSEGLGTDAQFIPDEQVSGSSSRLFGDKGDEFHAGDVNLDMRYEGLQTLFACCMGTAGVPTQVGSNNAYRHVLKINPAMEGIHGTLGFDKKVAIWEYTTCKLAGFEISQEHGQRAKVTFNFIPHKLNFNTGSGTNTQATFASVTLPANRDYALFAQAKVLINGQAGGALAAGTDDVYVSSWSVKYDNSMPTDDVTTQYGQYVDEPIQDGFSMVTGTLSLSKYQDGTVQTLFTDMISKARKKMLIQLTGPVIGTTAFQYTLYFPDVQLVTGSANVGGPQRIPVEFEFESHRVAGAVPTGFPSGYTEALTMENINQVNTNALA